MPMRQIDFRGGYGEHGRSCFLVNYFENRYYMVDCGIMDTDSFPYPNVTTEELQRVDYLFLTHCHKDHSGAFEFFVENGFKGCLVTTKMTLRLAKINYDNCVLLDVDAREKELSLGTLKVWFGRSGHCPGGIWFLIGDEAGRCLFSGDYQRNTLLYECDVIEGMQADVAVIDCAHEQSDLLADALRTKIIECVREEYQKGKKLIFPVPKYGRGIEMLCMLMVEFPALKIGVDEEFVACSKEMLEEPAWYNVYTWEKVKTAMQEILDNPIDVAASQSHGYDVILLADTHLAKQKNIDFVSSRVAEDFTVIITGRRKKGSYSNLLCENQIAKRFLYPHHQSRADFDNVVENNKFNTIFPFHNNEQRVIINS